MISIKIGDTSQYGMVNVKDRRHSGIKDDKNLTARNGEPAGVTSPDLEIMTETTHYRAQWRIIQYEVLYLRIELDLRSTKYMLDFYTLHSEQSFLISILSKCFLKSVGFSCTMESSDDENNGALENYAAKERRHTFPSSGVKFVDDVLNGKYYLVDNEYANIPGYIAPYTDVPYDSLNSGGGFHPQDAKELFNHRHSMLHNATHHTFAALKARFPILTSAPPYPMPTQVKLVVAACALHNYIRGETPDDWIFRMYEQETGLPLENSMPPLETEAPFTSAEEQTLDFPFQTKELEHTSQLRDSIATAIWNDYIRDFAV
ncbi:hypothetical protein RJ639_041646 [Escallonia herrerae]|uniref:DDE Tnp4 domain-containing protein n=1 Tax=Escallonia herrerae TaxID=1293975 RepID=A0AA88WHH2_9ASTE|nr:hypothetical protein RJ639_041646 [Escallonia herrerae]